MVNPAAVEGISRLQEMKGRSPDEILAAYHEVLKDDPQRLSTAYILELAGRPKVREAPDA